MLYLSPKWHGRNRCRYNCRNVSSRAGLLHRAPGGPEMAINRRNCKALLIQSWIRCQCRAALDVLVRTCQLIGEVTHKIVYSPLRSLPKYSVPGAARISACVMRVQVILRRSRCGSAVRMSSTMKALWREAPTLKQEDEGASPSCASYSWELFAAPHLAFTSVIA